MSSIINLGGGQLGKSSSSFYNKLQSATNEDKQVNPIYVDAIKLGLKKLGGGLDDLSVNYSKYTDGVFNCYYVSDSNYREYFLLQLECKLDVDLKDTQQLAKVLLQVCFYLKQFERANMQIPKVIVVGTKRNCFAISAYYLYNKYVKNTNYATEDENGNKISASTAPNHILYNPRLNAIANDAEIYSLIRITETSEKNAIQELCIDILKVAKEIGLKEDVTVENLARAYDFFEMKVIDQKQKERLTTREIVGAFMQLMLNPSNVTVEQTRNALGQIVDSGGINFNGRVIQVDSNAFNSFANVFAVKTYDIKDQKALTEIQDRLIEDTDRRRKGDFYTPTIWVNEAHKLMDKHLGLNWREKYMVWDCAWGTGNLTRDYAFDDLYCSTLIQEDLDTAARYNPLAIKFQYDFLNDDVEEFERVPHILFKPFIGKLKYADTEQYLNFKDILDLYARAIDRNIITQEQAQQSYIEAVQIIKNTKLYENAPGLIDSLLGINGKEQKDLVFLINPPYGTAKNGGADTVSKAGIADTLVNKYMLEDRIGACSQQLYAQFLFRIHKIYHIFGGNTNVGIFAPPAYITGPTYVKFREKFTEMAPKDGFILQGSQFADVKDTWGISFCILNKDGDFRNLEVTVFDLSDGLDNKTNTKHLYNLDNKQSLSDFVKTKDKGIDAPQMSNPIKWKQSGRGKLVPGSLGYMMFNANNIEQSKQFVTIMSSCMAGANGVSVTKNTFYQCIGGFTARRLMATECTWINWQDEYMAPNTDHPEYAQWQNDCIVYSLFNSKSNQSSLRSIYYNGKDWDIYNEFFWLSRNRMLQLAEQHNNMAVYDDVINHGKSERFVYEKLKTVTLSEDAKLALDLATKIVEKTFQYRQQFAEKHPEYHINTWDAGWYQIKAIAKEYCKEDLEYFNEMYKKLSDRMRPLVYELGFLYK